MTRSILLANDFPQEITHEITARCCFAFTLNFGFRAV